MRGTTRTKKDVPKVHAAFPVCTANFRVNRGASLQPNRTGLALFASTAPTSGVISIQSVDARPIWTRLPEISVAGDVGNDESDDSIRTARAIERTKVRDSIEGRRLGADTDGKNHPARGSKPK